jgi:sec-independent protein translocase protein TatB
MFDVGIPEIMVILVVAVIVFGPDRLPDYARQAGRMVRQLRQFAQGAQADLRRELGPEYADLKLADLDPRAMIRKHVLEALDEDDLDAVRERRRRDVLGPGEHPPYDVDAT